MAKKQTLLIPGNVLNELREEYQLNINQLASDIGLSVSAVRQIIANKAKISLHIAKRLSKYFNTTTVEYWIDLQNTYDLAELDRDPEFNEILKSISKAKKPSAASARSKKIAEPAPATRGRKPKKETGKQGELAPKPPRKPRAKKVKPEEVVEEPQEESFPIEDQ